MADESLSSIFTSILGWHLSAQPFPAAVRALLKPIIGATLQARAQAACWVWALFAAAGICLRPQLDCP